MSLLEELAVNLILIHIIMNLHKKLVRTRVVELNEAGRRHVVDFVFHLKLHQIDLEGSFN